MPTRVLGIRGDGRTDNTKDLEAFVAKLRPGDRADFGAGNHFVLTRGLKLAYGDVELLLKGSKFELKSSAYPENTVLKVCPPLGAYTHFGGRIQKGWFATERSGYYMFGTDPYDPNEEHYGVHVDSGTSKIWIPWDINGDRHKVLTLGRMVDRIVIRDIGFVDPAGYVNDIQLWMSHCRDVVIDGVYGAVSIGVQLSDCSGVMIRNMDVQPYTRHSAGGRALSMWQVKDTRVDGLRIREDRSGGIFMESWCRNTMIRDLDCKFEAGGLAWGSNRPIMAITGGCDKVDVVNLSVVDNSQIYLFDSGGVEQVAPWIDVVETKGDTSMMKWLESVDRKHWNEHWPWDAVAQPVAAMGQSINAMGQTDIFIESQKFWDSRPDVP